MEQLELERLQRQWREQGFAVLPGFYADADIDAALADVRRAWDEKAARIVVDDMDADQRLLLSKVSDAARRTHRFKLNDLYLERESVRHLALNARLTPILAALLGDAPALCNSLNFEQGSQQPDHVDALYMTPETPHHLVAAWVALEDCAPEAGPLRYYPGSHRIEPYRFSNGSRHFVPAEMAQWEAYIHAQVRERGLQPQVFGARKGDVFIWSAHLLHGGEPILDRTLTRRSLVFHYFSESDCLRLRSKLVPCAGGYWVRRAHQPVPGSLQSRLRGAAARLRNRLRGRPASSSI